MTTYDTTTPTVQIPTWSRGTVLKVWAAAALPMGLLAWVGAPLLAHAFSGPMALPQALILCLATGLIWQFVFVVIVVRREQGSLRSPVVKQALWLNAPISPRTGKRSKRLWWMVVPLMALLALEETLPSLPTPVARDNGLLFASDSGQAWMSGNWTWFALLIIVFVFNTALGEELLFRGLLLPRMGNSVEPTGSSTAYSSPATTSTSRGSFRRRSWSTHSPRPCPRAAGAAPSSASPSTAHKACSSSCSA